MSNLSADKNLFPLPPPLNKVSNVSLSEKLISSLESEK